VVHNIDGRSVAGLAQKLQEASATRLMIRTGLLDHVQLPAAQSLSSSYTLAGRSLATGRTERTLLKARPRVLVTMCMMKRMRINMVFKQTTLPSTSSSPAASHKARRTKVKAPAADDSSMEEVSGTTTISSHELSKESQVSSTGSSATSLPGIKDMLSDGAIIFKLKDLSKATENFQSARKVGTSVFRGSVHGMDVAIVVIKNPGFAAGTSSTSITADFVAEMKNLCSVHHTNLVKLIGGCNSGSQVYLVYEFIDTGNLRQYLRSQYAPGFSALPTWTGRLQVVLDVAKGLEYLHHHTHNAPFVHRHLKSSNILLDSELHARIAYFGVAKIRGETDRMLPLVGRTASVPIAEEVSTSSTSTSSGEIQETKILGEGFGHGWTPCFVTLHLWTVH
jgi:hypothetical protein